MWKRKERLNQGKNNYHKKLFTEKLSHTPINILIVK